MKSVTTLSSFRNEDGIGYVILQQCCKCLAGNAPICCPDGWQLVFVRSRFTPPTEKCFPPTEGEALAIDGGLYNAYEHKQNKKDDANRIQQDKDTVCYSCGNTINGKKGKRKLNFPVGNAKCYKCQRMGHFTKFYKSTAETKKVDEDRQTPSNVMKDIRDKNTMSIFSEYL